jgi:hypothetical protein
VQADAIVTTDDIPVIYVQGEPGKPVSEQAPVAFKTLEDSLPTLRGRKFYGTVLRGEYRACVAIRPGEEIVEAHPLWTIPGGKYIRRRIPEGHEQPYLIAPAAEELCARSDYDPSRPVIEFYRTSREVLLMVPVR